MSRCTILVACVCLSLTVTDAQVARPGDFLVASSTGGSFVYVITPNTNTFSTLAAYPGAIRGVLVGADNASYSVASGLGVFKTTPTGTVTTIVATLPMGVGTAWNDLDEDGQHCVSTGWKGAGGLFRVDPVSAGFTTLMAGVFPNAFCLDRDTGDLIVGENTSGSVVRIKRDGTITTVVHSIPTVYAMDFHPLTGEAFIAVRSAILRLDVLNTLTTFTTQTFLSKSIAILGNGDVVTGSHGTLIHQYDMSGKLVGTPYNGASLSKMCMAIEDEHNLWGLNTPTPGGILNVNIRFANHPGKQFMAAASFSPRPGIPVSGRRIPLNPDNLFSASLHVPQIFGNFNGYLDQTGWAASHVVIPKIVGLTGLRFFLAAVVIDPSAPSFIAHVSQEYGITIM